MLTSGYEVMTLLSVLDLNPGFPFAVLYNQRSEICILEVNYRQL